MFRHWRLELYFKSQTDLEELVIPFLQAHPSLRRVNITNKVNNEPLLKYVETLTTALPDIDLCVHYSIKNQYERVGRGGSGQRRKPTTSGLGGDVITQDDTEIVSRNLTRLQRFCSSIHLGSQQSDPNVNILLVSGSSKEKRRFDSVKALQLLSSPDQKSSAAGEDTINTLPPFYVAFNPFIPDPGALEIEKKRLEQKLETGLVSGIYFQFGTDLHALQSGIDFINQQLDRLNSDNQSSIHRGKTVSLLGSVFIPSKRFLAQMRFRPWQGVYLSQEYLSDLNFAEAFTRQLLRLYSDNDVVPLVETAVKKDDDLKALEG
ncbi:hypothetical protein HK102_009425, partial [Quaeritorhiza haematococci]